MLSVFYAVPLLLVMIANFDAHGGQDLSRLLSVLTTIAVGLIASVTVIVLIVNRSRKT